MRYKIIYIYQFLLFFGIFYAENFSIGSVSISHLWKIPLLAYMIYVVLNNFRKRCCLKTKYLAFSYKLCFIKLLNRDIIVAPFEGIVIISRYLNFPILFQFISLKIHSHKECVKFLVRLCQFGILSYIPFLLGILDEPRDAYGMLELEDYLNAAKSHVGLFQNPHGASVFLSISFIVLLYYIKTFYLTKLERWYNYLLLGLCLYCLYTSYVRTGYLMFVVGMLVFCWPRRNTVSDTLKLISLLLGSIVFVSILLSTNDYFRARVLELDRNGEKRENVGSGRLIFARNGLDLYFNRSNLYEFIFGHGQEEVRDNNAKLLHNRAARIYSHNGFVDALVQNGIVGLYFFLGFYMWIFKQLKKTKNTPSYRLGLSWLFMTLIFQATQGGVGFLSDLLGALILIVLELENKNRIVYE